MTIYSSTFSVSNIIIIIIVFLSFYQAMTATQSCIKHKVVFQRWSKDGGLNNLHPPAGIPAAPPLSLLRAASPLTHLIVPADLPLCGILYSRAT